MKSGSWSGLVAVVGLVAVAASAPAGDAGKPVTMTPDQMKWVAGPDAQGVLTAVTWGDPAKGAHGAFHKFVPGFTAPLHTHTASTRIVVLSGTMSIAGEDGKELKLPAGSFFTQPNSFVHVTKCLPGSECVVYLEADAKWDLKPAAAKK
jgi:anti-sigma factor ChrR (cupin superfamily)